MNDAAVLEISGTTATLTLNRPDSRNAMSADLLAGVHACLDRVESASEVTVLTLTGAGRAFCAGMDLKAVLEDPPSVRALLSSLSEAALRLRGLGAVTVASINGAAIGGGCGLAMVCDVTVSHGDAKVGFPEVDLGACPAVVAPWLVRRIGAGRARRVLLEGGVMTGERAHALGLVDQLAPDREGLASATAEVVARLSEGGHDALRATKALLNELDGSMDRALAERAAALSAEVFMGDEAQSRIRARFTDA